MEGMMTEQEVREAQGVDPFRDEFNDRDHAVMSEFVGNSVSSAALVIHGRNVAAGWWSDVETGERKARNVGELLMLTVSELGEAGEDSPQYGLFVSELTKSLCRAMEGHRKARMDDKLPHRTRFEVELADALIRIMDLAGGLALDLGGAVEEKLEYNRKRADHKPENRKLAGGKAY